MRLRWLYLCVLALAPGCVMACSCFGPRTFEGVAVRASVLVRAVVVKPVEGEPGLEFVTLKVLDAERGAERGELVRLWAPDTLGCEAADSALDLRTVKPGQEWVLALEESRVSVRAEPKGVRVLWLIVSCARHFAPVKAGLVGGVPADEYVHRFKFDPTPSRRYRDRGPEQRDGS